jgi:hypothetical protein
MFCTGTIEQLSSSVFAPLPPAVAVAAGARVFVGGTAVSVGCGIVLVAVGCTGVFVMAGVDVASTGVSVGEIASVGVSMGD